LPAHPLRTRRSGLATSSGVGTRRVWMDPGYLAVHRAAQPKPVSLVEFLW
jgi:hypothetical protein